MKLPQGKFVMLAGIGIRLRDKACHGCLVLFIAVQLC